MAENCPNVTGISPAEGPPGTIVKIRGENLGKSANDLLGVFICNVNCTCTAEWHPHYISCRTGMGLGNGSIIVVTKSGGKGTSTVKFRGYMPRVGLLTESAVWVDESKLFEEKPISGLSVSRQMSPSYMSNDPLGVAPVETGNFLPVDKLDELYPKSSGNSLFENFHPARYLLEKHLDTSFDSLKSGFYHLESQDTRSSSAPASLVRNNLSTILESLDILSEVQLAIYDDKVASPSGSVTEELNGIMTNCNSVANSMFKDILSRKDDADAKRNALNVLQRFRFLFNLQRNIEKNILQGDYEIVISDYNRAKALFQNSEVKSFQRALEKVDSQIGEFMVMLKEKLFEFPSTLDEQRRLIRYLTDLDCPGDPAWDCIVNMQQWIKNLFIECKNHHQKNETSSKLSLPSLTLLDVRATRSDINRVHSANDFQVKHLRSPSDGSRPAYSRASKKSHSRSSSLTNILPESLSAFGSAPTATPSRVQFLEELCNLIVDNIPGLWQLGKAYLSGQIGNKMVILSENREAMAKHTKKFSAMVLEIIKLFCNLVNGVLRPNSIVKLKEVDRIRIGGWTKSDSLVAWLPGCGRQISSVFETLQSLELPSDSVSLLEELANNTCEQCVKEILKSALNDVQHMENKESWELVYDENNTCISQLPSKFEKIVFDSVSFIKHFMSITEMGEKEQNQNLYDHIVTNVKKLIEAFLTCLNNMITKEEEMDSKLHRSSPGAKRELNTTGNVDIITLDKKLLITLSNCNYLKSTSLPRIAEKCVECGFQELQMIKMLFVDKINSIDSRVFDKYIENKGEPLIGTVEQGMLSGEYRWEDEVDVFGVRSYVRELVLNLVMIHNQVSAITAGFVVRIFKKIGELLAEEIKRVFECYSKYSTSGALQAYLEISVLEGCLKDYLTPEASKALKEAKDHIPKPSQNDMWRLEDMKVSFNKEMFFELLSFWPPDKAKGFEKEHDLILEKDDTDKKGIAKQPEGPPKAARGGSQPSANPAKPSRAQQSASAPPKASRTQASGNPAKPSRGQQPDAQPPKAPRGTKSSKPPPKPKHNEETLKHSRPVLSSNSRPLKDVASAKENDNPFLDDDDNEHKSSIEQKPSNPFEDDEESQPVPAADNSNPFLDDDMDESKGSNPFLD